MSENLCFSKADIMLPDCDLSKWSVIACDQYTSQLDYWKKVSEIVGDEPSALNIILPECYLGDKNSKYIEKINSNMKVYLENKLFVTYKDALFYVERTQPDGRVRKGIVGKINLEDYDYRPNSSSKIRATEKTVLERIPPRVEIRKDAVLEMPHIMLLVDDKKKEIIESLHDKKDTFEKVYDFELMQGAGHIEGYLLPVDIADSVCERFETLGKDSNGLCFCVGDGNHSLASAKECYNLNKGELNKYALAEVVNIHDEALDFEPIYRVIFGYDTKTLINAFVKYCGGEYNGCDAQKFKCVYQDGETEISVKPKAKLCIGTLQAFLDEYLKDTTATTDYIHGTDAVYDLCKKGNVTGFIFEGMSKEDLFPAVVSDGSLPRKTFSMGHADDKRFYLEVRKIK